MECNCCGIHKPNSEYYTREKQCKSCRKKKRKRYEQKHALLFEPRLCPTCFEYQTKFVSPTQCKSCYNKIKRIKTNKRQGIMYCLYCLQYTDDIGAESPVKCGDCSIK